MNTNENLNEKSSQSQASRILAYMQQGNRITGIEALELFGCFRLPARIADIRDRGYEIKSETITLRNGKRVKDYWMEIAQA